MPRRFFVSLGVALAGATILLAQDEAFRSGPKVGTMLPTPFEAYLVNGPLLEKAKKELGQSAPPGIYHCVVCDFGLKPTILVFAREPAEGKEAALGELLKKLDAALEKHKESYLKGAVIFLSPDARSSANAPAKDEPAKLLEEAVARKKLIDRLTARAGKLKDVIVGAYPAESPKDYGLNLKAEVTVLFYDRLKVVENAAFAEGKLTEAGTDAFLEKVGAYLAPKKKS